ncbi:outer membrane biogenesis protein BamB [Thalassoglobus neptunius]|uniref:Outer membrane biogenesis protein BamB n=1 Tax=Thalassoglobus neptunius TaxID=1938619 RepID=A0A5C5WIQ2_9PLAN|nr:PQQ-binding-like beta-propeller repeat protein [Thalassoglobus neptunius]TWT50009.1 outer membrane biogenesis protein BamB [Thalassoglobus neptunius]
MNEQTDTPEVSDASNSPAPTRSMLARWADRLLIGMLAVFGVMQIGMWTFWEPSFGDAIKNLITFAQIVLSTICIVGWWFLFAPVSRKSMLIIGVPVVALIAGWVASIRSIDFDGDMKPRFSHVWDESAEERLTSHLTNAESADASELTIPEVSETDMPEYRGVHRDGVVIGPELRTDWSTNPPEELWRHPCGGGYSSFSILGRQLITMEQRGLDEAVVCYDTETGREFWVHQYPASFVEAMGGPGPRSTPTIHEGAVYAFGGFGDLFKLDLKTGAPIWHVHTLQQFQIPNTIWAMTSSPLVFGNTVIANIGGVTNADGVMPEGGGLVAYDIETGEIAWYGKALPDPNTEIEEFGTGAAAIEGIDGTSHPGYSSPMLADLAGETVILNFDGTAFRGHNPENGEQYWSYPFVAGDHINVAQPLVFENDHVMISAGYGKGSVMLHIEKNGDEWNLSEVWDKPSLRMRCKFSSPIFTDGFIYGLDEGIMACIDPENGDRQWKGGRTGLRGKYGHGQLLLSNGKLVILTEKGQLVLVDPNPEELTVLGELQVLSENIKTWNPLAMARGKVFVRNATEVACYDISANDSAAPESDPSELATTTDLDTDSVTDTNTETGTETKNDDSPESSSTTDQ